MTLVAHQETKTAHSRPLRYSFARPGQYADGFERRSPRFVRRRPRINPLVIVAAFSMALLYDAISSAAAQSTFQRIWGDLSVSLIARYPIEAVITALALIFIAGLIIGFAVRTLRSP